MKIGNTQIIEAIGVVAVILSLLFVGYEINQNTRAMESSSRQELAAQDLAYISTALDSTEVARAFSKFQRGEELTPLEYSQLEERQHLNFRIFENAYYQYQVRALEANEWGRYVRIISDAICKTPAQSMWDKYVSFQPDFRIVVEEVRASCP